MESDDNEEQSGMLGQLPGHTIRLTNTGSDPRLLPQLAIFMSQQGRKVLGLSVNCEDFSPKNSPYQQHRHSLNYS